MPATDPKSFSTTLVFDQTPEAVSAAIDDVRSWWSPLVEGTTDALGGEFTYVYRDLHRSRHRITEHVPGRRIVWRVLESHLSFVTETGEWDGTDVVFEIADKGGKTELRFTHVGLTPDVECYDACKKGWTHYVRESLKRRIETGKGAPES